MGQLTLPESDTTLPAADDGAPFIAENRWFDFRNATIPWDEYKGLAADKRVCRPEWEAGGPVAMKYEREYDNKVFRKNGNRVVTRYRQTYLKGKLPCVLSATAGG